MVVLFTFHEHVPQENKIHQKVLKLEFDSLPLQDKHRSLAERPTLVDCDANDLAP